MVFKYVLKKSKYTKFYLFTTFLIFQNNFYNINKFTKKRLCTFNKIRLYNKNKTIYKFLKSKQ